MTCSRERGEAKREGGSGRCGEKKEGNGWVEGKIGKSSVGFYYYYYFTLGKRLNRCKRWGSRASKKLSKGHQCVSNKSHM